MRTSRPAGCRPVETVPRKKKDNRNEIHGAGEFVALGKRLGGPEQTLELQSSGGAVLSAATFLGGDELGQRFRYKLATPPAEDLTGKLVLSSTGKDTPERNPKTIPVTVKYVAPLKRITIERCDCYTDSEFAAIGDNFDGAVGYRVEDGKRYVKGLFHYAEDADEEIELWQDEDTDEPRVWHSNDTGSALSGTSFTFKLTADPAKPDFVQETVTYEGTVA